MIHATQLTRRRDRAAPARLGTGRSGCYGATFNKGFTINLCEDDPVVNGWPYVRSPNRARTSAGRSEKRFIGVFMADAGDALAADADASVAAAGGPPTPVSAAATRGFEVHRSCTKLGTGRRCASLNRL